ncbi:hypothetical protein [Acetobacterium wieringae]|uniref:hypothetical protein n=1 Tax=Acetobacterium wieringae TaxID=52694 RepID=UPI0026EB7725|nr:hypothetical protein [Acetobacterium wieringae]
MKRSSLVIEGNTAAIIVAAGLVVIGLGLLALIGFALFGKSEIVKSIGFACAWLF